MGTFLDEVTFFPCFFLVSLFSLSSTTAPVVRMKSGSFGIFSHRSACISEIRMEDSASSAGISKNFPLTASTNGSISSGIRKARSDGTGALSLTSGIIFPVEYRITPLTNP